MSAVAGGWGRSWSPAATEGPEYWYLCGCSLSSVHIETVEEAMDVANP